MPAQLAREAQIREVAGALGEPHEQRAGVEPEPPDVPREGLPLAGLRASGPAGPLRQAGVERRQAPSLQKRRGAGGAPLAEPHSPCRREPDKVVSRSAMNKKLTRA